MKKLIAVLLACMLGLLPVFAAYADNDRQKAEIVSKKYRLSVSDTEYTISSVSGLTIPVSYEGPDFEKTISVKTTGTPVAVTTMNEGGQVELCLEAREAGDSEIILASKKNKKEKLVLKVHTEESAIPDNVLLEFVSISLRKNKTGLELQVSGKNHSSRTIQKVSYTVDFRTKKGEQRFFSYSEPGVYDLPCLLSFWNLYWTVNPGEKASHTFIPAIDAQGSRIKDKTITEVRCAVTKIEFKDGSVVHIPDSHRYWFSSKTGYLQKPEAAENYIPPEQKILNIAEKFNFGIVSSWIDDFTKPWYGSSVTGEYVVHLDPGSSAEKSGLQLGDVIFEADGIAYADDPLFFERAKAKMAEGGTVVLKVLRNKSDLLELTAAREFTTLPAEGSGAAPSQEEVPVIVLDPVGADEDGVSVVHSSIGDISLTFSRENTYYDLAYQYPEEMAFEEETGEKVRHCIRYYADGFDPSAFGIVIARRKGISADRWIADELQLDLSKTEVNGITWSVGISESKKSKAIIYACDAGEYDYSISFNTQHPDSFDFADFARAFIQRVTR